MQKIQGKEMKAITQQQKLHGQRVKGDHRTRITTQPIRRKRRRNPSPDLWYSENFNSPVPSQITLLRYQTGPVPSDREVDVVQHVGPISSCVEQKSQLVTAGCQGQFIVFVSFYVFCPCILSSKVVL